MSIEGINLILLLNIDEKLKQVCCHEQIPAHMYKITRFMQDLRKYNVVAYMSSDQVNTTKFVEGVIETYLIA